MVYILFTISKESIKNFFSYWVLNLGPQPQSKSDDLDRLAIGPDMLLETFSSMVTKRLLTFCSISFIWLLDYSKLLRA